MSFSLASLLMVEEDVPATVRAALRAASRAPVHERRLHLEAAVRALKHEADLDCDDAKELVGLDGD
jgi:hypothetical protein